MTSHSTPQRRLSSLGCLLLVVLASILVFYIFWLRSPANAIERWNIKDTWVSTTPTGETIRFLRASLIPNGTIVVHTTVDTQFHRAEDFSRIQTMPIQTGSLSINPDGSLIAAQPQSSSGKGVVSIYRTMNGELIQQLGTDADQPLQIVWSRDSRFLAARYFDSANYVFWDSVTGQQLEAPFLQPPEVLGMVYTPDGTTVYLSTPDMLVAMSVATGTDLYRQPLPSSWLQLSPDNSTLIAYNREAIRAFRAADGILLWELGFAAQERNRALGFEQVSVVTISPDNQYIAAGEMTSPGVLGGIDDGQIALIRIADGTIVQEYRGQERGIGSLMFTADSKTFLSSNGKEIARWNVEPRPSWLIWLPIATIGLMLVHGVLTWLFAWWDQAHARQV